MTSSWHHLLSSGTTPSSSWTITKLSRVKSSLGFAVKVTPVHTITMLKIDAEIRKSSSTVQPPAPLWRKLARIGKTRKRYVSKWLFDQHWLWRHNDKNFSAKKVTTVKCVTLEPSSSFIPTFTRVRSVTICSRQPTVPEVRSARLHTSNSKTMINRKVQ